MNAAPLTTLPSSNDRLAALIAHGGTFFAWLLAPLLIYLLKRGESRYAEFHALQSLLWSLLGTIAALCTCGLAIPFFIVFHALATYRTLRTVRLPLGLRFRAPQRRGVTCASRVAIFSPAAAR